ncbi:hypothetical protein BVRB_030340 [Beta vulgaris subsp. vulgaris]|uniref:Glucosamine/galactosamine-6-phosphate isomerase domain-containing protein n=1 Tax=Beta vulgaris subsp. vulgaris TaxID=3555 RepID=A0A0J8AXU2_BETVV|nr:hypothetical protein BVRB_030340 [Beta vulgaris subsp. vulgaris]
MPLEQCPPTVHVLSSTEQVADHVANLVFYEAKQAIELRQRFVIGFSGGSIPALIGPELVKRESDFSKWWVLFVDERCVPHSDPESNFGLLKKHFLSHIDIPGEQIFAISEEAMRSGSEAAAEEYEKRIISSRIKNVYFDVVFMLIFWQPSGRTVVLLLIRFCLVLALMVILLLYFRIEIMKWFVMGLFLKV